MDSSLITILISEEISTCGDAAILRFTASTNSIQLNNSNSRLLDLVISALTFYLEVWRKIKSFQFRLKVRLAAISDVQCVGMSEEGIFCFGAFRISNLTSCTGLSFAL